MPVTKEASSCLAEIFATTPVRRLCHTSTAPSTRQPHTVAPIVGIETASRSW